MLSLDQYWADGFTVIEGWVEPKLILPVKAIDAFQREHAIKGPVLEIGVHHGRFLLALATLTAPDEATVGIDIFGRQDLNVDGSGSGNRQMLEGHIARYIGAERKVAVIEDDSLTFGLLKRQRLLEDHGEFRFISIDGGHTAEHTYSDLGLAIDIMAGGAVITVDDYYHMHWPGVHEGTVRFMSDHPAKIKPFCYAFNKLFFCSFSYAERYFAAFQQRFNGMQAFKVVTMWGSPVVVFH